MTCPLCGGGGTGTASPGAIVDEILRQRNVTLSYIRGPSRRKSIVQVRRRIAHALRTAGLSHREIAEWIGRHRTTVINLLDH